ncbi:MAG TPA: nitrilase-related carbon-nitrogen hydrolase [Acidobacteriota bacterium]|nr:nitrilase-related carbon-nitrogen hydrolase [Acidobacteriota bacterium]
MRLTVACTFDANGLDAFEAAREQPVDLLVLPELFDGGYRKLEATGGRPAAETILERFATLSRQHARNVVGGTLTLEEDDGYIRNTSVVFSGGNEIGRFSKVHLYRPLGEDRYFAPGMLGKPLVLECDEGSIHCGVIICYDLRFPEIVRPWFKTGLDLLVVPARWPRVRDHIWQVLLRARAIENQCFVIGVNTRDDEGGGSYAFGPSGEPLLAVRPDPQPDEPLWHQCTLDTEVIARVRERLDTRPDAVLL